MAPKRIYTMLDQQHMLDFSDNSLEMLDTLAVLKKRGIGLLTGHQLHHDDRAWPLLPFSIDDLYSPQGKP